MPRKKTGPIEKTVPIEKTSARAADTIKKHKQPGNDDATISKGQLASDYPKAGNIGNETITTQVDFENRHEMRPEGTGNKSQIVNLRVPIQIVDDIDYWVGNGRYRSRSEFVLAAIRYYLDYIEYRESYNTRTFQRGQNEETPAERIERLRYLRGNP